jgi:osmotically-inducible protein OsmY
VQVKDATVVLTGRLPYFLARQQAGTMAALVGGVAAVENRIAVDPSVIIQSLTVKELP